MYVIRLSQIPNLHAVIALINITLGACLIIVNIIIIVIVMSQSFTYLVNLLCLLCLYVVLPIDYFDYLLSKNSKLHSFWC